MKRTLIRRLYVWANATLAPLVGAGVLAGYHKLPPELQAMVDPWALTAIAVGVVSGGLSMALSKWQGIPVAEMQEWLAEKGLYAGRIDGLPGPQTKAALARAIEDPDVDAPEILTKHKPARPKVIRPMGGKI
jgi:hypothetical protein